MTATSTSLWRVPAIRWLFVITAVGFGGLFTTISALPLEVVRHGASKGIGGVVVTVLLALCVLTQAFVGRIIARIGTLPTLVIALVALAVPSPLYLVSTALPWWLAVSAIRGAGFGVIAVVGSLLAARLVEPVQLGRSIGLYGLAIAVSNLVCTPLGVALTTAGHFGWVCVISTMPVLAVGCVLTIAPMVQDEPSAPRSERRRARPVIRRVVGPSFVLFTVTFTGGGLASYLPIDRPSGSLAAVVLFVFAATGALCRFAAGSLADRFGARTVLPIGVALAVMGAIALGVTVDNPAYLPVVLAAGLFGLGFGAVQNLTLVLAFGRVDAGGTATASAFWNGAFDLGTSIGAFAIGAVAASSVGFGWALAGCAVLIGLSVLTLAEPKPAEVAA